MDTTTRNQRLFDYNLWATRRVIDSLAGIEQPPARALSLLAHILWAERLWFLRVQPDAGLDPDVTAEAGEARFRELAAENHSLWHGVSGDDNRMVAYANTAGQPFQTPLQDIITHVVNHGSHHRAQIQLMLRDAGTTPAPIDYIAWIRE